MPVSSGICWTMVNDGSMRLSRLHQDCQTGIWIPLSAGWAREDKVFFETDTINHKEYLYLSLDFYFWFDVRIYCISSRYLVGIFLLLKNMYWRKESLFYKSPNLAHSTGFSVLSECFTIHRIIRGGINSCPVILRWRTRLSPLLKWWWDTSLYGSCDWQFGHSFLLKTVHIGISNNLWMVSYHGIYT